MRLISGQLYQYLQSVQAYISPPIAAVFLIGVLWQRVNAKGAMAALLSGFVLGIGRLIAELGKQGLTGPLRAYADINFLHFAVLLFVVCSIILVVVSLLTPPPAAEKVAGLTFAARTGRIEDEPSRRWRRSDLVLSLGLVAAVLVIWFYFS
jgi:SSS family solute:Na+ symporter